MHFSAVVGVELSNRLSPRAGSVRDLLDEMQALRRRFDAGESVDLPMVVLHLSSGRDMTGWVMDVVEKHGEGSVYLQDKNKSGDLTQASVLCADLSRIEAVSVRRNSVATPRLQLVTPPVDPLPIPQEITLVPVVPTARPKAKLQIAAEKASSKVVLKTDVAAPAVETKSEFSRERAHRMLLSYESRFGAILNSSVKLEVSWKTLGSDMNALRAVRDLCEDLKIVIGELMLHSSRKEQCRRVFQVVRFEVSSLTTVELRSEGLVIGGPFSLGRTGFLTTDDLRDAIAQVI